jgi:hypothetical protein
MTHSYAEAKGVTSNSPAYGGPGWPRDDVAECGDSIGGCNRQTEAFDSGGAGSTSDSGTTTGLSKLVERHADSPACWEIGMKRKDIVIFGDNTIVRGWDGQVDASDSGVGGTGSYGEPKPIKPKPKPKQDFGQYHGKTDTLIHRSVDEFNSALGIDIGAETVRDSVGQDVASDSGVGGVSSCGGSKPPPRDTPYHKGVSRAVPLNRNAQKHRHNTEFKVGFDIEDKAFDTGEGGSTSGGVDPAPRNPPTSPTVPRRVRKYLHSTHLIGDPDIQSGACDSGVGGGSSEGFPDGDSDVGYSDRTTSFSRKVGGLYGRTSALNVSKTTKRQGNIDFEREIRNIREIIEQDHYDADAELSDE